jgi:hypothetical protein
MRRQGRIGIPFLTIGIAFLAIGLSGRKAFLVIGIAFLAIGFVLLVRARRLGS